MQIIDNWLSDIPQQFLGRERIEALIGAFSRQLQEIQGVFDGLDNLTDIDRAAGRNLDMVGNIVSLTRKDATAIIRKANDYVLTDDIYRQILRYKVLKNSCECTYEDIMDAASLLFDMDMISYREPPDRPATILLSLPTVSLDEPDPAVGRVLAVKPAGVAVIYTAGYWGIIPMRIYWHFGMGGTGLLWRVAFCGLAMKSFKTLDGMWNLDGTHILNEQQWHIPMATKMHIGRLVNGAHSRIQGAAARYSVAHGYASALFCPVETSIKATGRPLANAGACVRAESCCREDVSCSLVTKKSMWHLDGIHPLDGCRCLSAIEMKEAI